MHIFLNYTKCQTVYSRSSLCLFSC